MTTPEAALAARDALAECLRRHPRPGDAADMLAALHDAGYALTPLAPEVPPAFVATIIESEHQPVVRGITGSDDMQLECSCGWAGEDAPDPNTTEGTDFLRHFADNLPLAATRTPEPPDSGPHNPWASPSSEFDRAEDVLAGMLALQRLRGRLSKVTVSDVRTLLAAIPQPRVRAEPPDSGDGAAHSCETCAEHDEALDEAYLKGQRDGGIDAALLAQAIRNATWDAIDDSLHQPSAAARDMSERIAAEYARLRSGSPAPEGGE